MNPTRLICKLFIILSLTGCTFKAVEDKDILKNGQEEQKHESIDIEIQKKSIV